MSTPKTVLVIGAGGRGTGYASYALSYPEQLRIVGVAEPRDYYRNHLAEIHNIPKENIYLDWSELVSRERFADAVIIATPDALHEEPAIAFANQGYHMLLEKPMAPTAEACRRIIEVVKGNSILFAVCHVMRYTAYTQKVKEIVDSGRLGEIVSLQHLEPVGYWHQAHSFVRGNWRNEQESSFMLLAKSCHDLDWLRYIIGKHCLQTSSFGNLKHFRKENAPTGASERCLDCPVESTCPYSARKIYLGRLAHGYAGWPVSILTPEVTEESLLEALRTGPYGRCVYFCDNDVVDHQVVNLLFEGGASASFTMTAFNRTRDRDTRIFGTHGELTGNGQIIEVYDFLSDETETIDTQITSGDLLSGHGGGDFGLMSRFVAALQHNDQSLILSGADETLESHLMVFAAEQARMENRVVSILD